MLCIHHPQIGSQMLGVEPSAGQVDASRRQIDTGHPCASARELQVVSPEPNADFEHALAAEAVEVERLVHPRLLGVAMLLNQRERFRCARFALPKSEPTRGIATPVAFRGPANLVGSDAVGFLPTRVLS
jgi:hypothetical protein